MSKDPIVFVLGIPGHFYLAQAIGRRFNRPVVGVTLLARIEESLTPDFRKHFQEIFFLPGFYLENRARYEAMSRAELDALQQRLEKDLGIANTALLASYDRATRWCGDYIKARHWMIACMELTEKLLETYRPAFCIDGVAHFLQLSLRAACAVREIPYFLTQTSRINGHFNILHDDGRHIGLMETFAELQKGNESFVPKEILEAADKAFYDFINKPRRPAYAVKNSMTGLSLKKNWKLLCYALHPDRLFPSDQVRTVDRYMTYESYPLQTLGRGIVNQYRKVQLKFARVLDKTPDLDVPFLYLPLHYAPEVSDMYFGSAYDHHAGFVTMLSKHVPSHVQIYAKEHTSMVGRRPASFYRELNQLHNVRMIDPAVDTFALSKKAVAVVAVTGTAGWEAYLLGKHVIALGDVYYNRLPGIFHAPLDKDFKPGLERYLTNPPADEKIRLNAFRAFYATSSRGSKGDIGHNIKTAAEAPANAVLYAEGLAECIRKWGHTMRGKFPDDILGEAQRRSAG